VRQAVAQAGRFRLGEGGDVGAAEQFQPDEVDRPRFGRAVAQAGVFAGAHTVFDAGVDAAPGHPELPMTAHLIMVKASRAGNRRR
jgi:hypothetical protein